MLLKLYGDYEPVLQDAMKSEDYAGALEYGQSCSAELADGRGLSLVVERWLPGQLPAIRGSAGQVTNDGVGLEGYAVELGDRAAALYNLNDGSGRIEAVRGSVVVGVGTSASFGAADDRAALMQDLIDLADYALSRQPE